MTTDNQNPLDYEEIYPLILKSVFPCKNDRERVEEIVSEYGTKSFHSEIPRVRTAILKASGGDLASVPHHTQTACCDYRDILCAAEYPSQTKRWGLKNRDPKKYQKLVEKDRQQHLDWIDEMTRPA